MSDICQQKTRKITQQLLQEVRHELEEAAAQQGGAPESTRRIPTELLELIREDADQSLDKVDRTCPHGSEVVVDLEEMLRLSALGERVPARDLAEHSAEELFLGFGTELDQLLQQSLFPDSNSFNKDEDEDAPGAMWVNKPITPPLNRRSVPTDQHPRLTMAEDTSDLLRSANHTPLPGVRDAVPTTGWSVDLTGVIDENARPPQANNFALIDEDEQTPTTPRRASRVNFSAVAQQAAAALTPRHTSSVEVLQSPPPAMLRGEDEAIRPRRAAPVSRAVNRTEAHHSGPQRSPHSSPTVEAHRSSSAPRPAAPPPPASRALPAEARQPQAESSMEVFMEAMPVAPQGPSAKDIRGVPAPALPRRAPTAPMPEPAKAAPVKSVAAVPARPSPKAILADNTTEVLMAPVTASPSKPAASGIPSIWRSVFNIGTISGATMILLSVIPLASLDGGWPWSPWSAAAPALAGTWFLTSHALGLSLMSRRLGFVAFGGLFFAFCVAPALFSALGTFEALFWGLPHLLAIALLVGVIPFRSSAQR